MSMWSVTDETLLAALASGDAEAAAALVRRYQGRIYGLAVAIVGDAFTAEEVAQETFLRAWQHADAYDPRRGRVATWLLSMARNIAIDALRLRRSEPLDPQSLLALQLPSGDPEPAERGLLAAETARLRAALARLPDDQRRAVLMAAFYGRTAREVGELENVPLGTAKTRIRTALLKLRSALEVADEP
jgi:RNA polymerase sigma factor (sigma-70 family)